LATSHEVEPELSPSLRLDVYHECPRRGDNPRIAEPSHRHEQAAARHERAAVTHDRAAAFWRQHGDRVRADLHTEAAAHERAGAALEQRWADLIAREHAGGGAASGGE
jgi:hypothetical protein